MNPTTYKNPNENYFTSGATFDTSQPTQPGTTATPVAQITPSTLPGQTPPITTTQPSPTTVNATPYTGASIVDQLNTDKQASDFSSRTKLAQTYGITGYTGTADQNTQLLQKYRTGLQTAKASGAEAPSTSAAGSAAVSSMVPPPTPKPEVNPIDTILNQDKGYQQLQQDFKDYKSTLTQQKSLQDEYKQMEKDDGLPDLKTEAMNMKNVINGSESDIRNEITKAGGFATESQVQALTAARNKVLIQNYNKLTDQITNVQNHLDTMIGLSKADKANALEQYKTQIDYDKTISDYAQKFTTNAQSAFNNMEKTEGWSGIYKAALATGDPAALQRINSIMGPGFDIRTMALADAQKRLTDLQKDQTAQSNVLADNARANAALAEQVRHNKVDEFNTAQKSNPLNFGAPGEADKGKVMTGIQKLDAKTKGTIDMTKLSTDPQYFYWVKAQLGL